MLQRTRSEEERQNAVKVHKETVNGLITLLNDEWSLRLPLLQGHESPRSRRDRGSLERECVTHMVFLQYKDVIALSAALKQYKEQARILYSRWVHKPKGERIVPSATRQVPKPIMEEERKELVACLRELLDARSGPLKTPSKLSFSERFDDAPIASPRLPKPKRASNEGFEDVSSAKKAKSRAAGKENAMPPPPLINRRSTAQSFNPDVSFTSAGSDTIFSRVNSNFHASTQTTTPDEDGQSTNPNSPLASLAQPNHRISSSQTNSSQPDFGSSSFDAEAHAKLDRASEDPEEYAFNKAKLAVGTSELCAKLQCTFRKSLYVDIDCLDLLIRFQLRFLTICVIYQCPSCMSSQGSNYTQVCQCLALAIPGGHLLPNTSHSGHPSETTPGLEQWSYLRCLMRTLGQVQWAMYTTLIMWWSTQDQ